MKIVKISPKRQITIPLAFKSACNSGYFSICSEKNTLILRPIEIKHAKSEEELFEKIIQKVLNGGTEGI